MKQASFFDDLFNLSNMEQQDAYTHILSVFRSEGLGGLFKPWDKRFFAPGLKEEAVRHVLGAMLGKEIEEGYQLLKKDGQNYLGDKVWWLKDEYF